MSKQYRSPSAEIKLLAEGSKEPAPLVQILRTGEFQHPRYGKFLITKETLQNIVKNFNDKVLRIDIAVDYKHDNDDVAAGWFKALSISTDGNSLMADVQWTPNGTKVLTDKEFRYLSAEFVDDYKDNETQASFGTTLLGAGLTNRPFVKGMEPIVQLSEPKTKGETMTDLEKAQAEAKKLSDEKDANAKLLAEANKKLADMEAANKKAADEKAASDKKAFFDKKLSEGVFCEAQREAYMSGDVQKLAELAQPVKTKKLSEAGDGAGAEDKGNEGADAEEKILALADAVATEKKIAKHKAVSIVLADPKNKELRKAYEAKFLTA
jgi:phage I-like protein